MGLENWSSWMAQAQKGDQEAYKKLLNEIYPVIQNFLIKKIGPYAFEEDMVQECLISIHKAMPTYDPNREFRAWMYAIVRNKLIDILRKKQRTTEKEINNNEILETKAAEPAYTANEEVNDLVQDALGKLPDEMKKAVELTKIKGLSTKEAASELNCTEASLRTRISRAYSIMRIELENEIGW